MSDRRTFLRQLAGLPLIGGSIALIGAPTAVAEPVTAGLMEAYKTWLHLELRGLASEMAADPVCVERYGYAGRSFNRSELTRTIQNAIWCAGVGDAGRFHNGDRPEPSARAALVLSAVGCEWRGARA
jgi:hypothetical protein